MNELFRLAHVTMSRNGRCPVSGDSVGPSVQSGFQIFRGPQLLATRIAQEMAPPDLLRLKTAVDAEPPVTPGEKSYGIIDSAAAANTQCARDGLGFPAARRGQWEISGASPGGDLRLLSLLAGQELAPTLAHVLHDFYGTKPAERPKVKTPDDEGRERRQKARAERDRAAAERERMRQVDREKAIKIIAAALVSDAPARERAAAIIDGLNGVFARAD